MGKERTLVISDIHGCYDAFNRLLERVNYEPVSDQLILLGDFVSKGPDSKQVVEQAYNLVKDDGAIAIQGNHDERFVDIVRNKTKDARDKFFRHGGRQTVYSYLRGLDMTGSEEDLLARLRETVLELYPHHADFLEQLPYYFEDEHFIYVHAGLNPKYPNWKDQPKRDFLYIKDSFHKEDTMVDKVVVFGHTKTVDLHGRADVWYGKGKIGIDGGCASGLQLNALEIIDSKVRATSVPARRAVV